MELVLRRFLVHGIVKVDGVGVLQSPVSPHQSGPKDQQDHDHCGARDKFRVVF